MLIAILGFYNYPGATDTWEETKYDPATGTYGKNYTYNCMYKLCLSILDRSDIPIR